MFPTLAVSCKIDLHNEFIYLFDTQLLQEVDRLNKRRDIHGIIVQLPLDTINDINTDLILNSIAPEKDVDG